MEDIFELYEIQYSDLLLLSSDQEPASHSHEEIQRLELISKKIMQNLGPNGPGLLSINGFPRARVLRQKLLPLARKLALLSNDERKRILKEHDLGTDIPLKNLDRLVSSFAMQMKYGQEFNVDVKRSETNEEAYDAEFKDLGFAFRGLGFCLMELGLCLARACDKIIGGFELERSLLQCGTAKGRLIHYHSITDNAVIKETAKRKRSAKNGKINLSENLRSSNCDKSNLWQQWHYDYGIFTILTSPMFLLSSGNDEQECESPSDHTYLQVFHPEKNGVLKVKASKESCIVQVGESADLLSNGKLRATLHCVCRETEIDNLSRETFVAFLQPAWNKKFSLSDHPIERLNSRSNSCAEEETNGLIRNICEIVPPLWKRVWNGMTFAEFSKETTKQYYGGRGLQANRKKNLEKQFSDWFAWLEWRG